MNDSKKKIAIKKDPKGLGMPWEAEYGYAQAVKVGDTVYVSGQLSHDDRGSLVGPAPLDGQGRILDHSNMEIQMRQTYANATRLLGLYGATLDNVVDEVLYVTHMDAAFAVAGSVRKEAYGSVKPTEPDYDSLLRSNLERVFNERDATTPARGAAPSPSPVWTPPRSLTERSRDCGC